MESSGISIVCAKEIRCRDSEVERQRGLHDEKPERILTSSHDNSITVLNTRLMKLLITIEIRAEI